MSKYIKTPNAKSMPPYLAGVGATVQRQREIVAQAKLSQEEKVEIAKGRLTTAKFKKLFPKAINHGQGNFEDESTGSIWEAHDGFIVRRTDSSIRDVLKAINDQPEMSDEEYFKLIKSM
jgi:hypothetical protein